MFMIWHIDGHAARAYDKVASPLIMIGTAIIAICGILRRTTLGWILILTATILFVIGLLSPEL